MSDGLHRRLVLGVELDMVFIGVFCRFGNLENIGKILPKILKIVRIHDRTLVVRTRLGVVWLTLTYIMTRNCLPLVMSA